jgi:ribosome-associated translation inhibitor RaiA
MEFDIRGRGLHPTPVLRRYIERRLRYALRPFELDRVTVRLTREGGRGRSATQCCQVAILSHGYAIVRAHGTHESIHVACVRAAGKARRALSGAVHRGRRGRPRSRKRRQ